MTINPSTAFSAPYINIHTIVIPNQPENPTSPIVKTPKKPITKNATITFY